MKRSNRLAGLVITLGIFLLLTTSSALAQEEPAADTTTTTVGTTMQPAVPITVPSAAAPQADWTYRYMIPTAIVLAVLIILVTTIRYFTSVVRKRYRVVRE
ncbi:MAG: hypothetical protein WCA93_00635 [Acidimicrobiia bacterium]